MLTEQETNDMHTMVSEFEMGAGSSPWRKLKALAETTGDAWEKVVREYLAEWLALRR